MGVTAELENLGDARLSKEIAASIEHALSDRRGDWRVTIAGSRASENWEMRFEVSMDLNGRNPGWHRRRT
jgi:hypothetical protein